MNKRDMLRTITRLHGAAALLELKAQAGEMDEEESTSLIHKCYECIDRLEAEVQAINEELLYPEIHYWQ